MSSQHDQLWYVGLTLELCGSTFNLLGKQCLRHAGVTGNRWWVLVGLLLWYGLYPVFNIFALTFAPTTIVFAADGMIVVWNIIAAPYTLGEPVTVARLTSAVLITVGTIGGGVFGTHSEPSQNAAAYGALFDSGSAIIYNCCIPIVALTLYLLQRRCAEGTTASGLWLGLVAGWLGGCGIYEKAALAFASDDGIFSTWTVMFSLITIVTLGGGVAILVYGLQRCALWWET